MPKGYPALTPDQKYGYKHSPQISQEIKTIAEKARINPGRARLESGNSL